MYKSIFVWPSDAGDHLTQVSIWLRWPSDSGGHLTQVTIWLRWTSDAGAKTSNSYSSHIVILDIYTFSIQYIVDTNFKYLNKVTN